MLCYVLYIIGIIYIYIYITYIIYNFITICITFYLVKDSINESVLLRCKTYFNCIEIKYLEHSLWWSVDKP